MKIEISSGRRNDEAAALAEASRRSMARLMAVAGHDLKQPIQVAMLSIISAAGKGASPAAAHRLAMALDALRRLNNELDDIARLSQRDGALKPQRRAIPLDDVIARVERDWRGYAEIYGTQLQVRLPRIFVETDPEMLGTILRNLIGNAIKFSGPRGHVSVSSRLLGNQISIDVHDTGGGIPESQLSRIFDAFERGNQAHCSDGLGLGLLIVRQTAELLRHPISVRSIENEGSTFSIELPVLSFPDAQSADVEFRFTHEPLPL